MDRIRTESRSWLRISRRPLLLLGAIALGTLDACASQPSFNGQEIDPAREAPELSGLNWNGEPFRLSDQRGKVAVLFFGFTFCPDVCPMTLFKMKEVYDRLGDQADDVAFVFVSVDPKRDTPEKIGEYVSAFDPRFYGVYLGEEGLQGTTQAFDVTVRYVPLQNPVNLDGSYNVDHTGTYFVLDRQGRIRLHFPPRATAEELLPDLLTLLAEG